MEKYLSNREKNPYHMLWHTKDGFYIKNNVIHENANILEAKEVWPLQVWGDAKPERKEKRGAYLDFININYDENSDKVTKDILDFVSEYGLLLNDVAFDRRPKEYSGDEVKILSDEIIDPHNMEIFQFIKEAKQLRYLVEPYSCKYTTIYDNKLRVELKDKESLAFALKEFIQSHKASSLRGCSPGNVCIPMKGGTGENDLGGSLLVHGIMHFILDNLEKLFTLL